MKAFAQKRGRRIVQWSLWELYVSKWIEGFAVRKRQLRTRSGGRKIDHLLTRHGLGSA
jgi:hypothetical protein